MHNDKGCPTRKRNSVWQNNRRVERLCSGHLLAGCPTKKRLLRSKCDLVVRGWSHRDNMWGRKQIHEKQGRSKKSIPGIDAALSIWCRQGRVPRQRRVIPNDYAGAFPTKRKQIKIREGIEITKVKDSVSRNWSHGGLKIYRKRNNEQAQLNAIHNMKIKSSRQ